MEFQQQMKEINQRSDQFADVFAPDAIDVLEAAVEEALFLEGNTNPLYRGRMKRYCLRKVAERMQARAAGEHV